MKKIHYFFKISFVSFIRSSNAILANVVVLAYTSPLLILVSAFRHSP